MLAERYFKRFLLILSGTLVFLSGCGTKTEVDSKSQVATKSQVQDARPNVVFILADDLGHGQLGFNGQTKIKTPNIDAMAQDGVIFTQAYSGSTVCSPSRISLLTGRDGRSLHSNTNAIKIRKTDTTFAQLLQKAGYTTKLVGKYGVGNELGYNDPMTMGFDSWYGIMQNVPSHRQYPKTLMRDNVELIIKENQNGNKGAYAQELWTQEAEDFLSQKHNKPFFLYLSYTTPHAELAAPEAFYREYQDSFEETPYLGLTDGVVDNYFEPFYKDAVEQPNATMAAMVTALDSYVGRVRKTLQDKGLSDNTIVIFTSDNGPHEEGGASPAFFDASKPFRGVKRDLLDGGIHVPFIVKWGDKHQSGSQIDEPIAFADMLPTFADMALIADEERPNRMVDGRSIYPLLSGEKTSLPDAIMYWEFVRQLGLDNKKLITQAAREGEFKAVRYGVDTQMSLYNIVQDPGEITDLSQQNPELAKMFQEFLDTQIETNKGQ